MRPISSMEKFTSRFWERVNKTDSCWEWLGCLNAWGYGIVNSGKPGNHGFSSNLAHRVSWVLANGDIPDGMCILHHCDNRKCVNPSHLFIGTRHDNMVDCLAKGRFPMGDNSSTRRYLDKNPYVRNHGSGITGERHPRAKFTDAQVDEIRRMHSAGERTVDIVRMFGVSRHHVWLIVKNKVRKGDGRGAVSEMLITREV